jgi:uncharacterized Tic20 family protein
MSYRDVPAGGLPSQEERVAAGIAHLGIFGGFWLVAPLVVYFWKGKTSRFVGFHAIQAGLLNVLAIPLTMLGFGVGFAAMIVFGVLSGGGQRDVVTQVFGVLGPMTLVAAVLLPNLLVFVYAALAGVRALQGREWPITIIGRIASSVVKEP